MRDEERTGLTPGEGTSGGRPRAEPSDPELVELGKEDCEQVIGHIESFLSSDQTAADADDLRENVSEHSQVLAAMSVDDMIRLIMRRSCSERAPETLRVRITTQIQVWRTQV